MKLLTVEEYERIPDPPGGSYELHHGELVFVTKPIIRHSILQRRLQESLSTAAKTRGCDTFVELPYCPMPKHELWVADVACVSVNWLDVRDKWLIGSPEIVIEVKSPSNTNSELHDKGMTTLAGEGATEFWIADPATATITVYSKREGIRRYGPGESVAVPLLGISIEINPLFANL